jgi:hypothetical protein
VLRESIMFDVVVLALTAVLVVAALAYVGACERL